MRNLRVLLSGTADSRRYSLPSRLAALHSCTRNDVILVVFDVLKVINNACATQAILSILLNISQPEIDLGNLLTEFKEFAFPLDPAVRQW